MLIGKRKGNSAVTRLKDPRLGLHGLWVKENDKVSSRSTPIIFERIRAYPIHFGGQRNLRMR